MSHIKQRLAAVWLVCSFSSAALQQPQIGPPPSIIDHDPTKTTVTPQQCGCSLLLLAAVQLTTGKTHASP
jgi:hypothetical protein